MSEETVDEADKVLENSENEAEKIQDSSKEVSETADSCDTSNENSDVAKKESETSQSEDLAVKTSQNSEIVTNSELVKPLESKDEDDIGEPPSVENVDGEKDFMWCDNYEFVEDEKIAINYDSVDPKKSILLAAQNNEIEVLRKLLEEDLNLVNARDNDLYTPLHRAAYSNNVEVIRILLMHDADVRAKTIDGWEPLHCACKWDSVEAVSLLIQNGADVNAETNGHITPLHLAASNVHGRRTLELLLWHPHIDPNITNDGGDTAYDIACRSGPLGALFEILEESLNVY